jgi:hypothetical protein
MGLDFERIGRHLDVAVDVVVVHGHHRSVVGLGVRCRVFV